MSFLKEQRYGKDKVRVVKVVKQDDAKPFATQDIYEMTLCVLLDGDFEESYTRADNSKVVPTDTVKNTIYYLTKKTKYAHVPEIFCKEIAQHFLNTYSHVSTVYVSLLQHNWTRLKTSCLSPVDTQGLKGTNVSADGKWAATNDHPHSYARQSEEQRVVNLVAKRNQDHATIDIESGIRDLYVLKTTGSYFVEFHTDKYTTLPEMKDRLFSTSVLARWNYDTEKLALSQIANPAQGPKYNSIFQGTRQIFVDFFANHNSPSVQNTLYLAGQRILNTFQAIKQIHFALPNKHVFPYDLSKLGVDNTGSETDTYYPVSDPSGK
jgi:urate oxidase